MKNITFTNKNIKYYRGNIKRNVLNLYTRNKALFRNIKELIK